MEDGKSLTWLLVIEMFWNVAAILPSVSVSVASVFPAPNPEMSETSRAAILFVTVDTVAALFVDELYVPSKEYVVSCVVRSPVVPSALVYVIVLPEIESPVMASLLSRSEQRNWYWLPSYMNRAMSPASTSLAVVEETAAPWM